MVNSLADEKSYADLSSGRRWLLLAIASMGSSIIYAPAYLKAVFYDPLREALGVTNTQLGAVFSAYAITALICYLPSGILADKIRMRTLATVGFTSTALLTFVYATLPSLGVLYAVFVLMGVTTILIWWGVRYKLQGGRVPQADRHLLRHLRRRRPGHRPDLHVDRHGRRRGPRSRGLDLPLLPRRPDPHAGHRLVAVHPEVRR